MREKLISPLRKRNIPRFLAAPPWQRPPVLCLRCLARVRQFLNYGYLYFRGNKFYFFYYRCFLKEDDSFKHKEQNKDRNEKNLVWMHLFSYCFISWSLVLFLSGASLLHLMDKKALSFPLPDFFFIEELILFNETIPWKAWNHRIHLTEQHALQDPLGEKEHKTLTCFG